jgi:hypothetical protein
MRIATIAAAAAVLALAPASLHAAGEPMLLAQGGGTGGSGMNTAGSSGPHTGGAPGSLDGTSAATKRASGDEGASNPASGAAQGGHHRMRHHHRHAGNLPEPSPGAMR